MAPPPTSGRRQPLAVQSVGRPVALFGFARLLLQLRDRPVPQLQLVQPSKAGREDLPA